MQNIGFLPAGEQVRINYVAPMFRALQPAQPEML
jgi:hypothetical protein